jgi:hypothetical protein
MAFWSSALPEENRQARTVMLSQEKLLKVIDSDMRVCLSVNPTDAPGKQRQILELTTLTRHLEWARSAGDDKSELEQVVGPSRQTRSCVTTDVGHYNPGMTGFGKHSAPRTQDFSEPQGL